MPCVSDGDEKHPKRSSSDGQGEPGSLGDLFFQAPKQQMGVSKNSGFSPQIIHFNRVFHCKPSILGYPYFWKHLHQLRSSLDGERRSSRRSSKPPVMLGDARGHETP